MTRKLSDSKEKYDPIHVILVGNNHFQNELIAKALEVKATWICSLASDPSCVRVSVDRFSSIDNDAVILLDCSGLDSTAIEELIEAKAVHLPSFNLVGLYNLADDTDIEMKAVHVGVRGFFYVHDTLTLMAKGLKAIVSGELWISRKKFSQCLLKSSPSTTIKQTSPSSPSNLLTKRESEILALLSTGASNDIIASKLFISIHTVRTHIYNIFKKINVSNRMEAALWAAEKL